MSEETPEPNTKRLYCLTCKRPVSFCDLGLLDEMTPGVWHIVWQCACGVREVTKWTPPAIIERLLGDWDPQLPYTACPLPSSRLSDNAERLIASLAAELSCVESATDFLDLWNIDTGQADGS